MRHRLQWSEQGCPLVWHWGSCEKPSMESQKVKTRLRPQLVKLHCLEVAFLLLLKFLFTTYLKWGKRKRVKQWNEAHTHSDPKQTLPPEHLSMSGFVLCFPSSSALEIHSVQVILITILFPKLKYNGTTDGREIYKLLFFNTCFGPLIFGSLGFAC